MGLHGAALQGRHCKGFAWLGLQYAYPQASFHPHQWHHCSHYLHKLHLLENEHHDMPHEHVLQILGSTNKMEEIMR